MIHHLSADQTRLYHQQGLSHHLYAVIPHHRPLFHHLQPPSPLLSTKSLFAMNRNCSLPWTESSKFLQGLRRERLNRLNLNGVQLQHHHHWLSDRLCCVRSTALPPCRRRRQARHPMIHHLVPPAPSRWYNSLCSRKNPSRTPRLRRHFAVVVLALWTCQRLAPAVVVHSLWTCATRNSINLPPHTCITTAVVRMLPLPTSSSNSNIGDRHRLGTLLHRRQLEDDLC
jgi:hypothetical protein